VVPTAVGQYGWVMSPVKAGLRPPPPAADGLDRGHSPAFVGHQALDSTVRPTIKQTPRQLFSLRHLCRILRAIHTYRKSHSAILMVQSAQDGAADDIPGPLNVTRDRGILIVSLRRQQNVAQMPFAGNYDMINAFPSD
jgi:hypothetical protein